MIWRKADIKLKIRNKDDQFECQYIKPQTFITQQYLSKTEAEISLALPNYSSEQQTLQNTANRSGPQTVKHMYTAKNKAFQKELPPASITNPTCQNQKASGMTKLKSTSSLFFIRGETNL